MDKQSPSVEESVGDAIRQKRLEKGLSQSALGGKVDLTFQQIQKYEKGISKVSATKLVEIADALDSDVRSFFHEVVKSRIVRSVESPRVGEAKDIKSYRDAMILSSAFLAIEDEQVRRTILQLVQVVSTGGTRAGRSAKARVMKPFPVNSTP